MTEGRTAALCPQQTHNKILCHDALRIPRGEAVELALSVLWAR